MIVVDDGSTDTTSQVVRKIGSKKVTILKHKQSLGKGKAIQTGLYKVTGDYVLIQDADLEYDPDEIPVMTKPIKAKRAEVVYG